MLTLLALAPEDGWAFIRDGAMVVFLRPPYTLGQGFAEASEAVVARAITDHGFTPSQAVFNSWSALVAHLRAEIVEAGKKRGLDAPEEGIDRALLRYAMPEMLEAALDGIEEGLLPRHAHAAAEQVLVSMLTDSPALRQEPKLLDRAVLLLRRVRDEREHREQEAAAIVASGADITRLSRLRGNPGDLQKAQHRERAFVDHLQVMEPAA
jgi:hypothetical protein